MWNRASSQAPPDPGVVRPSLELSGPALTASFETLVASSEDDGGIEHYVEGLKRKVAVFQEALGNGNAAGLDRNGFAMLCAFMAPVRRRIGPRLEDDGFGKFRAAITDLLGGDPSTVDARIQRFCACFPEDGKHRWVRDLAAELLHYSDPERYPLMCRWVWDAKANSGVLREIWYADDVDHMTIDVRDDHQTFTVLREELSQFLTDNGVFRDVLYYVDLLCAKIYAGYIDEQGGTYLRTDFSSPEDPLQYVRRLLGLDGVNAKTGRTRLKTLDGRARVLEDAKPLD